MNYCKKQPCPNCPYRKDAPLAHWSIEEFKDLISNEKSQFGDVYDCHKKDKTRCTGWLIMQRDNNYPSINLRLSLIKNQVPSEELDALNSPVPMYETIEEMAKANYPKQFKKLWQPRTH